MPLPANNTPWPPKALVPLLERVAEYDAWYGGERDQLAAVLGRVDKPDRPSSYRLTPFWRKEVPLGQRDDRIHVPLPADIATVSADLLFAEPPTLTLDNTAAQDRLTELVELAEVHNRLLEAAEVGAALGGVYLKADWDADVADHPLLAVVHADKAAPEFRWGRLVAVTFWREVAHEAGKVTRHLERHSLEGAGDGGRAVIEHGLYVGTDDNLGMVVPLTDSPETADLAASLTDGNTVRPGIDLLTAQYVPNLLPNRGKLRNTPHGRSDFQQLPPIFDALDETYTSWMRDLRLAKARLVVPNGYLESQGRGKGATFDLDRELYEGLEMPPPSMAGSTASSGITLVQFAIRWEEHSRTAEQLVRKAIETGGYSAQTFGLTDDGGAVTATEVTAKERRSMVTRDRKGRYWRPAVRHMAHVLLALDAAIFGSGVTPAAPLVEFGDGVSEDPHEVADTLALLEQAKAASTETKVRALHPEWDDKAVDEEVQRIKDEGGMGVLADPAAVGSVPPGAGDQADPSRPPGADASTAAERNAS